MSRRIKIVIRKVLKLICIFCIPTQKKHIIPYKEAEQIIENHFPNSKSSCLTGKIDNVRVHDLSIIVPVYNVAHYLEQCITSIINQKTTYDYEIIAIDDGSTDNSPQILEEFVSCEKLKVIHQNNQGLSSARNAGIQKALGKYLMFVDSDDYLTETAVESLMNAALTWDSCIVQGGYYDVDQSNGSCLGIKQYNNNTCVAPNGVVAGMAWGKIYKAELFSKICFPEKYWFEDTIITSLITHSANKICTISDMVYCYRLNQKGITHSSLRHPKSIDTYYVLKSVLAARKELNMHTDKAFYEHLMRLIALGYKRTKNEPDVVRRSIFALFKKMLEEEKNENSFKLHAEYKALEKAFSRGDYGKYCLLCRLM